MRANEFLGPDRRTAQFRGWHAIGKIEVRAWDREKRLTVAVAPGDYVAVDFLSNELIRPGWRSFSRVEVRFANPRPVLVPTFSVSAQRRRLFIGMLTKDPDAVLLEARAAQAAVLRAHPEAAPLFEPGKRKDPRSQLRRDWRDAKREWDARRTTT
jgi:hypothetical protein